MPVRRVTVGGRPAYRWGARGKAYTYDPDDPASRRRALASAQRQGLAARARGYVADADDGDLWRIAEPGAPSWRGLSAVLRRWTRRTMAPLIRAMREAGEAWERDRARRLTADADGFGLTAGEAVDLTLAMRRALEEAMRRRAVDVPEADIEREAERAARVAAASSRRAIGALGADRDLLAARLAVPARDLFAITGPLSEGESEAFRRWVSGVAVETPSGIRETGLAKIRTMPQEMVQGIENWLVPERLQGRRWDTIAKELQGRLGIDERHAELIARDQIGKLNGAITEATQAQAGIVEFIWQTSRDERVRDLHVDLEATRWRWDDLPESGTNGEQLPPGMPIQCRCWARPVIPEGLIR